MQVAGRQRFTAIAMILMAMVTLYGCVPSRQQQFQERLDRFRSILPENARTAFDSKRYETVVAQVDSLLVSDAAFAARWQEMKAAEAISLFTTTEVINYFVINFVNYRSGR